METNSGNKAKLFAKMAKVIGELSTFDKDKENKFHNYWYASAEKVFLTIGRLLAKHGIAHFISVREIIKNEKGHMLVWYEITLADTETGESLTSAWAGEAQTLTSKGAVDDKAINKCATTALKYFLLSTFVISTGDNEEGHESEDLLAEQKTSKSASKSSTPANAEKPKGAPTSNELGKESADWLNKWAFTNFGMSFDDVKKALDLNKHIQYFKGTIPKASALVLLHATQGDFDSAAQLANEKLGAKAAPVLEMLEELANA
jgi:hypothetical protein